MEEIKIQNNGEQLSQQDEQTLVQEEHINLVQNSLSESSPLNKFKSVDNLVKAYTDLEKVFTKKCQQLKELENKQQLDKEIAPNYASADWTEKVCEFFEKSPKAKQFVDEISEVLSSDKVLSENANSLELAYAKVLESKYKTNEEIINDENFINNFVLKNKNIKEKIVREYLDDISTKKAVPLMSGGGESLISPNNKPKSLTDAGKLAKALFKI